MCIYFHALIGNCMQLDDTVLLSATSTRPSLVIDVDEVSVYRRLGEVIGQAEQGQSYQEELEWMESLAPAASSINYKDAILTYITG